MALWILNFMDYQSSKKAWTFKCGICGEKSQSQALLNQHHKDHHSVVNCKKCKKNIYNAFNTCQTYVVHGPLKHACSHDKCKENFAFASELDHHLLVHQMVASFQCHFAKCSKWYFSKSRLMKHIKIHDGIEWKYKVPGCIYSTTDK